MGKFKALAAIIIVSFFGSIPSWSYTAYLAGKWTYPGCDTRNGGNTCVIKVDLPGPPEEGAPQELVNVVESTITQVSGVVYVASPVNPYQFYSWEQGVIVSVWFTSDGSPCPIPN